MLRALFIALMALVLAACATAPTVERQVLADVQKPVELSSELECMVDCLQDASETCEECAGQCLERHEDPTVAATFALKF